MSFRPLSALSEAERGKAAALLKGDDVLAFYWATAIEDLARGFDNRLVRFCRDGGIIIGAIFGELTVFSVCGRIGDEDIAACAAMPGAAEIHAPIDEAARYQEIAGRRLTLSREMVVMSVKPAAHASSIDGCRILGEADAPLVAAFYRSHYPETVFDPYMLFMPFVGAFAGEELIACAGTIVVSDALQVALIGHFATAEKARGQGYAGRLGAALLQALATRGFGTVYLATTNDNAAAIRVYQRLGFGTIDRRAQLDLMP